MFACQGIFALDNSISNANLIKWYTAHNQAHFFIGTGMVKCQEVLTEKQDTLLRKNFNVTG
jgi:hypothetical protein